MGTKEGQFEVKSMRTERVFIDGFDLTDIFEELAENIYNWIFYRKPFSDYPHHTRGEESENRDKFFDLLKQRVCELIAENKLKNIKKDEERAKYAINLLEKRRVKGDNNAS